MHFSPKIFSAIVLILAGIQVSSPITAQSDRVSLNFSQLLSQALSQSYDAKQALLRREQAALERSLVGYAALPRFGVDATWAKRQPEASASQARDQMYSAQISYNIYDFGKTSARRRAADAEIRASEHGVEEINEEITWQVARSYLALIAAQKLLEINRQNLSLSQSKFATMRANYSKGLRPENDLVSAEADLGNVQLSFDKAEADVSVMRRQMEILTGDTKMFIRGAAIAESSTAFLSRTPAAWRQIYSAWPAGNVSAAERRRAFERDALLASETVAASTYRPTLDLALVAQEAGTWDDTQTQYSGQVQFSWDLPWPGALSAERRRVSLQRNQLEMVDAGAKRARIEAEVIAMERIASASRLWTSAERQLGLRLRQYEMAKRRYDSGKASALELSNSELELGNARIERVRIANMLVSAVLELAASRRIKDPAVIFN